jgi:hypothetical protein
VKSGSSSESKFLDSHHGIESFISEDESFNPLKNLQENWAIMREEVNLFKEFKANNSFFDMAPFA